MIALLAPAVALGGPWTRDLGSAYVRAGADVFVADSVELPGSIGSADYTGTATSLYGEFGLSRTWPVQVVVAAVPVAVHRTVFDRDDSFVDAAGYATVVRSGDLRLGPQVALHRKIPLAVAADVKIPMYRVDDLCSGELLTDVCARPGDGQVDVTGLVLAGSSFARGAGWVEGNVGYRLRTEAFLGWTDDTPSFSDGIPFSAGVGAQSGRLWGMARLDGLVNVDRTTEWTAEGVRVGPVACIRLGGGMSLEARLASDLWVANQSRGTSAGLGVSRTWYSGVQSR